MREDYVSISPAQLRAGGQQDIDYMLDRPPFTRYFWTGSGFEPVSGANTLYTAAQLEALALAGGLTPYATYIPSDADPAYQLWARSASEFGVAQGGGFSESYAITVDGNTTPLLKPAGASRCAVSATGDVNYAVIYVEDSDTGDIWGAFGAPMSGARWCNVPVGQFNLRARIEGFSGTSMTVTLAGGV